MNPVTLLLDSTLIDFYSKIALSAGLTLEQVLQDALFKLAGELSLEALHSREPFPENKAATILYSL